MPTPLDLPRAAFGGQPSPPPAIGMAQWFTERARRGGARPALSFEGRSWTYAELLADVERLATVLADGGLRPGMRVAYLGLNHPMFLVTLFASARLGAVFVPLNFRLTGPELAYILGDVGVHTLLVGAQHQAAIDADGWFRTGDVGYADADGFWYVCDRVKDMVITGGEHVYPAEVESALAAHPAVAEVAVVGAPDDKWGETVVAVVALKPGHTLDLDGLHAFASERLARYKVPRRLRLVDALPRNPTGKVLKYLLRGQHAG